MGWQEAMRITNPTAAIEPSATVEAQLTARELKPSLQNRYARVQWHGQHSPARSKHLRAGWWGRQVQR